MAINCVASNCVASTFPSEQLWASNCGQTIVVEQFIAYRHSFVFFFLIARSRICVNLSDTQNSFFTKLQSFYFVFSKKYRMLKYPIASAFSFNQSLLILYFLFRVNLSNHCYKISVERVCSVQCKVILKRSPG